LPAFLFLFFLKQFYFFVLFAGRPFAGWAFSIFRKLKK